MSLAAYSHNLADLLSQPNGKERKYVYKYYYCLEKKKDVGLIPTIAHALLEEIGNHAALDLYILKILDKWQAEENVDTYEQQYLK
ncbi:hypothetical protein RO3G_06327 [Rhizopus delemar RA 99-880]|uniref:Uncharacterized protein n=1 Tax=Rhizopus delemar (strain RA 99-880 / ATCC MYA-4621 / FGSC 9543 / NRRL 43880) TaxID=246409 RepID=I1BZJ2_RHIO9|nr:hypothetical protein RO3G_06327 [Rhizopus delemar RA 99-880]|eukprot:EIE81622.1 hypothetical protein RO3G_06327 [Rhizopus delemar RA 99-880]